MHSVILLLLEFAREMVADNRYRDLYVNERVSKCQQYIHIYHENGIA